MTYLLLFSVFVVATCGLIYELITGALASYLLGDSVTQFSTIIGTYLFAMGVGSYFSKFFYRNLLNVFIEIEIVIGIIGGFSAAFLFVAYEYVSSFRFILYTIIFIIGCFVGLEIPLLMRILKDRFEFKDLVSKIFTYDYIGALIASISFPLLLVPYLGLVRSALLFGIFNVAVALMTIVVFKTEIKSEKFLRVKAILTLIIMVIAFGYSERLVSSLEVQNYRERIVFKKNTSYQKIVLTQSHGDMKLYLNGNLQFSSKDEYRYHESLVHVGLGQIDKPRRVLILGGGDGLAAREVLKYPSVEEIVLVDLDDQMTGLFKSNPILTSLNQNALTHKKVQVVNQDAFVWVKNNRRQFDFVIVDFPDPSQFALGKLYSRTFYGYLMSTVGIDGLIAVQSTSPYVAKKSFQIIVNTLNDVGLYTRPYHVYVPSFGEWGYVLASRIPIEIKDSTWALPAGLQFLSQEMIPFLFQFSKDLIGETKEVNRLNNQVLVRTFEQEWENYGHYEN
ncbi:MAG: polyamine aminopropyltransferase [Bdellovibrionaceae bacterium]|nr:polyamine aminopropyltransferase [Pseudobdellovibrionaceae bacterium]